MPDLGGLSVRIPLLAVKLSIFTSPHGYGKTTSEPLNASLVPLDADSIEKLTYKAGNHISRVLAPCHTGFHNHYPPQATINWNSGGCKSPVGKLRDYYFLDTSGT